LEDVKGKRSDGLEDPPEEGSGVCWCGELEFGRRVSVYGHPEKRNRKGKLLNESFSPCREDSPRGKPERHRGGELGVRGIRTYAPYSP